MKEFWSAFRESVIIQAVVALVLLTTICYMYATKQEVPEALINFFAIVLGYYFGSKVQAQINRR
jgi:hypothetical protein